MYIIIIISINIIIIIIMLLLLMLLLLLLLFRTIQRHPFRALQIYNDIPMTIILQ